MSSESKLQIIETRLADRCFDKMSNALRIENHQYICILCFWLVICMRYVNYVDAKGGRGLCVIFMTECTKLIQ